MASSLRRPIKFKNQLQMKFLVKLKTVEISHHVQKEFEILTTSIRGAMKIAK